MSTSEQIYKQLRQAIVEGVYESGDPLRQDQIANEFGVSKIPVREALVQLESDGFVEMYSGRGAFVAQLSISQAQEFYLMRIALEPIILEHAIPLTSETDWLRAGGILAALSTKDLATLQWHSLDLEFHTALYYHAKLPVMQKLVANLHRNLARYYTVYETLGIQFRELGEIEHHGILEACKAGDIQSAKDLLAAHLERSSNHLLQQLASESNTENGEQK